TRLAEIDPELRIIRRDTHLFLDFDGNPAGTFEIPSADSGQAWGSLTAAAVNAGRQRSKSLQQASAEKIYEAVFDGIVTELDDFSRYASRAEARDNRANRDGFHGIGVRIEMVAEGIHVVSVMDETPAAKAGLREGDIITEVDGVSAQGLTLREAVDQLRGPLNSRVNLMLKRASSLEPVQASVVREHIVPQTIAYRREGNAAYIRVSGFNQDTSRSLRRALSTAREEIGSVLTGYIIDLRDNPGGLLDQAVAVSDLFVSSGPIVSTHGRHRDSHQFFDAEDDDLAGNLPVAVLVNGRSASASEIVAAALQDSGRAVVIGSSSFGKGTVQTVLRLPNDGELTLTWARFHAPSGYALHHRGVLPNVCTSIGSPSVDSLIHSIATVPQHQQVALRRTPDVPSETEARALRSTCPAADGTNDLDLKIAKRLLSDHILYRQALSRSVDSNMANADFVASD
ncbi:MAG: S41 family peptidase, partial [Rhodovibrionaceae bacterium]|nr:S41 family peptidase [Rhodovibrionaceae bacterium]